MVNEWWETVLLIFGCVAALLFLLWGIGKVSGDDDDEKTATLDTTATLHLLADVAAEAHAQGTEAQRAMEELREIAPQLEADDWRLFEDRYRETVEAFSTGQAEINDQMEHLERIFRRDRVIGQARRSLRDS
ncbi:MULTISPECIES: hypothetical protein [Nesterenkonia]|uniref:hypothetical protein n=1 Tax=Nesterenkonia TaxID=57494 RepID=UPI0011B44B0A|nr:MULTISPECIES: hypothetical protein [Nesterenkonia]